MASLKSTTQPEKKRKASSQQVVEEESSSFFGLQIPVQIPKFHGFHVPVDFFENPSLLKKFESWWKKRLSELEKNSDKTINFKEEFDKFANELRAKPQEHSSSTHSFLPLGMPNPKPLHLQMEDATDKTRKVLTTLVELDNSVCRSLDLDDMSSEEWEGFLFEQKTLIETMKGIVSETEILKLYKA